MNCRSMGEQYERLTCHNIQPMFRKVVLSSSKGLRESMYSWVISEISDAERVGVPVRVDGVLYSTRDARVLHQVMEDHYYMKSYVGDEAGKICEIDFDHITEF